MHLHEFVHAKLMKPDKFNLSYTVTTTSVLPFLMDPLVLAMERISPWDSSATAPKPGYRSPRIENAMNGLTMGKNKGGCTHPLFG